MGEPTAKDLRRSTDRRVVRTRKAIREAFFKLMENQDYHKITIASVAREADIDRKTFYLHYRSVSDLVDEVIRRRGPEDRRQLPRGAALGWRQGA